MMETRGLRADGNEEVTLLSLRSSSRGQMAFTQEATQGQAGLPFQLGSQ